MILKILMGQRIEGYPGEHAPEALEVMTEYDYDENSAWLHDKMDAQLKEKHWESVKIIDVKVSQDKILEILRPSHKPLDGEIK